MAEGNGYTPTERRLLDRLDDGQSHDMKALRTLLNDELSEMSVLKVHIANLRKKLRAKGRDIVCVFHNRKRHYLQIRRIQGGVADE